MSAALPIVYLARHGETAWTLSGQHTGVTDLLLTARGEAEAVRLGERLEGLTFAARWLGFQPGAGRYFLLGTASLSAMGYEHDRSEPVIRLWDESLKNARRKHGNERKNGGGSSSTNCLGHHEGAAPAIQRHD